MSKFEEWWEQHEDTFRLLGEPTISLEELAEKAYLAGQVSLAAEMGEVEKQATEMAWEWFFNECYTEGQSGEGWKSSSCIGTAKAIRFLLSRNLIEKHGSREWYRHKQIQSDFHGQVLETEAREG